MMPKDPEENTNNDNVPPEVQTEDMGELEKALTEAQNKAGEYLSAWQRSQADFINFKRRAEQDRLEFGKFANANLCTSILPVVDDLERAISHIPAEYAQSDWVEGVKLVEKKFKAILEGLGVKPICALGMEFDPTLHEALKQEKGKEGMVIGELQKGYTLNDKLLRPARVVVGSGEGEEEKPAKE